MARPRTISYALPCALLIVGVFLLFAGSYRYPPVFDDKIINPVQLPGFATSCLTLAARCLSYTTLAVTYLLAGLDPLWFRLGNVLCHALASLACFLFFDRLFDAVRRSAPAGADPRPFEKERLLAFCGAVLFALHPVALYGPAYLVQRSIIMATLFSLLSLAALVHALSGHGIRWMWLAVLLYVAALFSKEHAVMLPAVGLAIAVLLDKLTFGSRPQRLALAAAVAAAAFLITFKLSAVVGTVYEYYTRELTTLQAAGVTLADPVSVYFGSVATQAWLFFKYLALWLVPNPGWMSVDLRQPIASGPFDWPYVLALPAYLLYGGAGVMLLLRRGSLGLLGLGMLFPWLLFFTEFVTARIQEPFVLYRSYLWMAGLVAILPFVAGRLQARHIIAACAALALLLSVLARERLATFESPLALWDDVVRKNTDQSLIFVDRGYSNRAVALLREGRLGEAMSDLDTSIRLNPKNSHSYVNRAAVLGRWGEDARALADLEHSIELDPQFAEAHAELCAMLLRKEASARALEACNNALKLAPDLPLALLNRAVLHANALRMQEALADLERVLKFEPGNAIALYNRGMVHKRMARAAESEKDLREACRLGFAPACGADR